MYNHKEYLKRRKLTPAYIVDLEKSNLRSKKNYLKKKNTTTHREQERMRDKRKMEYETPESRIKRLARGKLRYAVKMGRIIKLPCEVCREPITQGHHSDYSKPLDVIWVCREHHAKLHYSYGKL